MPAASRALTLPQATTVASVVAPTSAVTRWLLVACVSVGLIGMHHLISGSHSGPSYHRDATSLPAAAGHSTAHQPGRAVPMADVGGPITGATIGQSRDSRMETMGHPCMAVLPAADLPAAGVLALDLISPAVSPVAVLGRPSAHPARAPPSAVVRLTQLCVSRR